MFIRFKLNRLIACVVLCFFQSQLLSQQHDQSDTLILRLNLLFEENTKNLINESLNDDEYYNFRISLKLALAYNHQVSRVNMVCYTSPKENVDEIDTSLTLNRSRIKITKEFLIEQFKAFGYQLDEYKIYCRTPILDEESELLVKLLNRFDFPEKELVKRVLPAYPDKRGTNLELINYSKNNLFFQWILKQLCRVYIEIILV